MLRKKIFGIVILILAVFLLQACGKKEFKITRNYYMEDTSNYGKYLLLTSKQDIFKQKPSDEKKYDSNLIAEDLEEQNKFILRSFTESKTETSHNSKKREYTYNIYFDLKSFSITYEHNNKTETIKKTFKYLTNVNLKQEIDSDSFKLPDTNIWLIKGDNNQIVTNNVTVTTDLHLVLLNDFLVHENYNDVLFLQEISSYLKTLLTDDALKAPDAYPIGYTVVKTELYEALQQNYQDSLQALLLHNDFNNAFSKLKVSYDNAKKENVVGSREVKDVSSEQDTNISKTLLENSYKKLFADLTAKYTAANSVFQQIIKDNSEPINLNNYYTTTKVLPSNIYTEFEKFLSKVKQDLTYLTYNEKNLIISKQNLMKLTDTFKTFDENANKFLGQVKNGTKSEKLTYKIIVYKNGQVVKELSQQDEKYKTVVFEPTVTNLKSVFPEFNDSYKLLSNSKLTIVLSQENQELHLYFVTRQLRLTIDLNGGTSEYSKNYLEVEYNSILDPDQKAKLINITKNNDQYGTNYVFSKFVNAYNTSEEIDLSQPIVKECSLLAIYTFNKKRFNYKIQTFFDIVSKKSNEPLYSDTPLLNSTSTELVYSLDLVYHNPAEITGYTIDRDRSVLSFGTIGEDDIVKIYYKRKLLLITFEIPGNGVIVDDRITNNAATVKYESNFDFIPETIKYTLPNGGTNQTYIYDKLIDKATGLEYNMNQPITKNLDLEVKTKLVTNIVTIKFYPHKLGIEEQKGDKNVSLEKILYLEKDSKIASPSFFLNYHEKGEVLFDNEHGFIRSNTGIVNKDTTYQTDTTLYFVYNLNLKQLDNILKEQFPQFLGKDTEREVSGQIIHQLNDKNYILETDLGNVLVLTDNLPSNHLSLGAKYRLSGIFLRDTNEFGTDLSDTNYFNQIKIGRYTDYVLKINNNSNIIKTHEAPSGYTETVTTLHSLSDSKTLSKVDVKYFLITDTNDKQLSKISLYDTHDGYYQYRGTLANGEVAYLLFPYNASNLESLLSLNAGDTLDLNSVFYLNMRIKRSGINDFRDGAHKSFPVFYLEDYEGKVTYLETNTNHQKVNVTLALEFNLDPNLPRFSNTSRTFYVNNKTTLKTIINELLETEVFNGYEPSEYFLGDNKISLDNVFTSNSTVKVKMSRSSNIINFIWGTYAPHYFLKDLKVTAYYGRKHYQTSYIDYADGFYKFVLNYHPEDDYLKLVLSINSDKKKDIIIDLSLNKTSGTRTFVAFDGGRYSPVKREFGEQNNKFYEYTWAAQNPFEIGNRKGFFVTTFGIKKDVNGIDTLEEYADGLFYSRIMLQNSGTYNKEGDFNINKDWNMENGYTKYDGHLFYQFDEDMSIEDIITSRKIDIRAFAMMHLNDYNDQGEIFKTTDRTRFYFHRDSLHKLVKFNRFGLGVIHLDLSPYVSENGKDYIITHKSEMLSTLPPELQDTSKPIGISTNNSRVFASKEAFLDYLRINNVPCFYNGDGSATPQTIARQYDDYQFNLVDAPAGVTFANGLTTITIKHYKGENNHLQDLSLLNADAKFIAFVPRGSNIIVHQENLFQTNYTIYDVFVLDKQEVNVLAITNSGVIPSLNIGILNYEETVTGEYVKYIETALKKDKVISYKVSIPQTTNSKLLPVRLNAYLSKDGKKGEDSNFLVPLFTTIASPTYIYFETSNKLVVSKTKEALIVLLTDSSGAPFASNLEAYLKYSLAGSEQKLYTKVHVLDNTVAFVLDKTNGAPQGVRPFVGSTPLYTHTSGLEVRFARNNISFIVVDKALGSNKSYSLNETFNTKNEYYNRTKLTVFKHWLVNEHGVMSTTSEDHIITRPSFNNPVWLKDLLPTVTSEYEIFYTMRNHLGEKVSFDPYEPLTRGEKNMVIHAYYKPKTNPSKLAKVVVDLQGIGTVDNLTDELLFNYYYQARGNGEKITLPSQLPFNVSIPSYYQAKYSFKNLTIDNTVISLNSYVIDKNELTVKANYNDNNSFGVITITTFIESEKVDEQKVVANIGTSYQVNTNTLTIPAGYEIDQTTSILSINSVKATGNSLKITYKQKNNLKILLDFNGGSLVENDETTQILLRLKTSYGFINSGNNYIATNASYNLNITKLQIIKLLTTCAPVKNGKPASYIKFVFNHEEYTLTQYDEKVMQNINFTHDVTIQFCYE